MFSDDYHLTQAVLNKPKTMTRRKLIIPTTFEGKNVYGFNVLNNSAGTQCVDLLDENENIIGHWRPKYEVGEVVAIAQPYKDIIKYLPDSDSVLDKDGKPCNKFKQGWNNKMFVEADLMPHHIKITNVKIEHLQDISDYDILHEGVRKVYDNNAHYYVYKYLSDGFVFYTSQEAFTSLINKIMGEGTWDSNPWVVVYEFALID